MASLAAAAAVDTEDAEDTRVQFWAVVHLRVPRGETITAMEGDLNPPIRSVPTGPSMWDEELMVLSLQVEPDENMAGILEALMWWYYRTYDAEWLAATLAYRRQKPPHWVRERVQSPHIAPDEAFFDRCRDWPLDRFKWYAVVRGGELAWDSERGGYNEGPTKADIAKMTMGHLVWNVLLRIEEPSDPFMVMEQIPVATSALKAADIAVAAWKSHGDRHGEQVSVEAVFLGGVPVATNTVDPP